MRQCLQNPSRAVVLRSAFSEISIPNFISLIFCVVLTRLRKLLYAEIWLLVVCERKWTKQIAVRTIYFPIESILLRVFFTRNRGYYWGWNSTAEQPCCPRCAHVFFYSRCKGMKLLECALSIRAHIVRSFILVQFALQLWQISIRSPFKWSVRG